MNIKLGIDKIFLVGISLSLIFSSCGSKDEKHEIITVGALLALTGENASHGITEKRGIELALEEINSNGGILGKPLKIVFADMRMEAEPALAEYRRLVSIHNVPIILGVTGSGVALALAEIAAQDKVVLLSDIDTSPELTRKGGRYFFRVIPSDDISSKFLARWAIGQGWTTAALIYNSQNAWSLGCKQAIESAFNKAGGKIIGPIAVTDQTVNFKSQISTLKAGNPQAYFVTLMGRQAGLFVRQCADKKIFGPFLGTDNLSQDEFPTNAGEFAEKAYFAMPFEGSSPKLESLRKKYEEKYGQTLEGIAINAYDSLMLTANIIESILKEGKNISGEVIREKLLRIKFKGLIGDIEFTENGDLKREDFEMFIYKDGNVIPLVK